MLRWMRMVTVCCILALAVQGVAEEPKGHRRIELQDGDTLVFCGDSITHQCLYSQYVETFFYTRYPERRIRFHNASVGGDRVGDALARFHIDIAPYKPKYVTILLGMNDGTYQHFNHDVFKTYDDAASGNYHAYDTGYITDPTGDADARVVEARVGLLPNSASRVAHLTGMKVIARFQP